MRHDLSPLQQQQVEQRAIIALPAASSFSSRSNGAWKPIHLRASGDPGARSADVVARHCDLEQKGTPLCPYLVPTP